MSALLRVTSAGEQEPHFEARGNFSDHRTCGHESLPLEGRSMIGEVVICSNRLQSQKVHCDQQFALETKNGGQQILLLSFHPRLERHRGHDTKQM
jgi:hypothetical protein